MWKRLLEKVSMSQTVIRLAKIRKLAIKTLRISLWTHFSSNPCYPFHAHQSHLLNLACSISYISDWSDTLSSKPSLSQTQSSCCVWGVSSVSYGLFCVSGHKVGEVLCSSTVAPPSGQSQHCSNTQQLLLHGHKSQSLQYIWLLPNCEKVRNVRAIYTLVWFK